jgi:hypothetical protein
MVLKRRFKPLLAALGIRVPRGDGFYILRHGNATLMSSFGTPQKTGVLDASWTEKKNGSEVESSKPLYLN